MSTGTWPLSAAATQLLIDLRPDRAPDTTGRDLARLAVKELVVRGDLRVLRLRKRWLRAPAVHVATNPNGPTAPLLPPLDLLAQHLPDATHGTDLAKLVRAAAKSRTSIYSKDLKASALAELIRLGLAEERYRKALGLWPRSFPAPTPAGVELAAQARQDVDTVRTLRAISQTDPPLAHRMATALGALLLLAPAGLAIAIEVAERWRAHVGAGLDAAAVAGEASFLERFGDSLGDLIELVGSDLGLIDGAIDAVAGAVESGIDAGVSDGGGDGGSGGGDGGGGGCGGGCGGS